MQTLGVCFMHYELEELQIADQAAMTAMMSDNKNKHRGKARKTKNSRYGNADKQKTDPTFPSIAQFLCTLAHQISLLLFPILLYAFI
jgi:hypothetical protein